MPPIKARATLTVVFSINSIAEESRTHKVLKDIFSHIHHRIFLKYPHIPQKIRLVYRKIYSFKTASHLSSNKFLMDFAVTSCGKVMTLQGSTRRKTLKFVDERLISSTLFGYTSANPRKRMHFHSQACKNQ